MYFVGGSAQHKKKVFLVGLRNKDCEPAFRLMVCLGDLYENIVLDLLCSYDCALIYLHSTLGLARELFWSLVVSTSRSLPLNCPLVFLVTLLLFVSIKLLSPRASNPVFVDGTTTQGCSKSFKP